MYSCCSILLKTVSPVPFIPFTDSSLWPTLCIIMTLRSVIIIRKKNNWLRTIMLLMNDFYYKWKIKIFTRSQYQNWSIMSFVAIRENGRHKDFLITLLGLCGYSKLRSWIGSGIFFVFVSGSRVCRHINIIGYLLLQNPIFD